MSNPFPSIPGIKIIIYLIYVEAQLNKVNWRQLNNENKGNFEQWEVFLAGDVVDIESVDRENYF